MRSPAWIRDGVLPVALLIVTVASAAGQRPLIRPTVDHWLTCVECTGYELDSLKVLAIRLPATIDTLRADLLSGPSSYRRDRLIRQLEVTWQRMADRVARDTSRGAPAFSQSGFVRYYLGNMIEIYQGRAALALGAIGGPPAQAILDSALTLPAGTFPPGVLSRIRFARDSIRP